MASTVDMSPFVVEVRRNSLDDGPGIRSVVFFKGCPLRCVWCQNPETLSRAPQLQVMVEKCVACSACVESCAHNLAAPGAGVSSECRGCGGCAEACVVGARKLVGKSWSPEELAALLLRDEPFYRASGGGVTFSGGEPTLARALAGPVARLLATRGVHVLLETCGDFAWESFERDLLPHLSTIYFDVKVADSEQHREHTGRANGRILENLRRLSALKAPELLPRIPLVPRITDRAENLAAIAELLTDLEHTMVALLPYNPLWIPKRESLGLDLPYSNNEWMSQDAVARCREILERAGLEVV